MRDTVFSPSFGNRPTYLVGREDTVRELLEGLESRPGSRERSVVLLGQRGSGKTVLLWELAGRATELGYAVASPTIASEAMLGRIVEKIQDSGKRFVPSASAKITGGSIGALGFSVGLEFTREVQEGKSFQYKLTQLARRLTQQGHGTLILVDELQANSPEVRQLVAVYQEMIGEGLNVSLVLAGLPGAVSETLNDKVLTFLNRAQRLHLGPLHLSDVDSYFARVFSQLGISIDGDTRHLLAEKTGGSPYMLQLVGHNVVTRADEDGAIDDDSVRDALEMAQRDYECDVCSTTLSALSDRDRDFLECMVDDEGESRIANIAARMGVTQDYAQKYRRRLLDAGVIEQVRRGYVRYAVPYLDSYLRRG
ncbi:AAA family ATPase [Collinsella tanakaei]|uniref:ATP-binding protein n=1 Tax=Collinsella tanakaei TaxID=626935 RepID=UPI00195D1E69|nr:AAA family ATPase [Collinsella tanakaei]MBM6778779.1 AAA family ATPase [Collinsella tanakaei]